MWIIYTLLFKSPNCKGKILVQCRTVVVILSIQDVMLQNSEQFELVS